MTDFNLYLKDLGTKKTDAWRQGDSISFQDCLNGTGKMEKISAREALNLEGIKAEKDDSLMNFGKYAAKTMEWVREHDARYFEWAMENVKGFEDRVAEIDEEDF